MQAALAGLLEKASFDIVQLESVHLAGYLPILWNARQRPRAIVCDWHNIESEILARYSDGTASLARRLYARYSSRQLAAYERWFTSQCDLHIVVSERDRATLMRYETSSPILVIDNGVDVEGWSRSGSPETEAGRFRVLFAGSMDYHANIDAVTWFARGPWPDIRRRLPGAVFTVAGRNPSAEVRALSGLEGVEITGTVSDLAPYYREALVAVVPLRVAGGTRIKILEAMAAGVPVVSTARGAEGLAIAPGTHYILADRDTEMSAAVVDLAGDRAKRECLAAAAAALVRQKYDWSVLGDRLAAGLLSLF
jgi:glycosyltransferase involved in cell wall biosynthesis